MVIGDDIAILSHNNAGAHAAAVGQLAGDGHHRGDIFLIDLSGGERILRISGLIDHLGAAGSIAGRIGTGALGRLIPDPFQIAHCGAH